MHTTPPANLAFLHDYAYDQTRSLSVDEQTLLQAVAQRFREADTLVICLGGKAGRLGESVVGTGLLESVLQARIYLQKEAIAVHILVDEGIATLFQEALYQQRYGPGITIHAVPQTYDLLTTARRYTTGQALCVLDFHGAHDGMPSLETAIFPSGQNNGSQRQVTLLGQLFRVGIRSYAQRGPERRYADFVTDLLSLPTSALDGQQAQPRLYLSPQDAHYYSELTSKLATDRSTLVIMGFFQSVVPAKCYERWDEVLQLLCAYFAQYFPSQKLTFLLPCGPDQDLPAGIQQADIEEWFQDFATGTCSNAQMIITSVSLQDLAILTSHATIALSNDTGPAHIAGALQVPTVTTFLPGTIYSSQIWSSTLWHYAVTVEPNPYSYRELEAAVVWGRSHIINSIPPEAILRMIIAQLPARFQINHN